MHKCKILTTSNGKGGTGKTTLNTFIAETLFARGNNILLIDLDHNCCLSEMYGFELQEETSKDFLSGKIFQPYLIKETLNGEPLPIKEMKVGDVYHHMDIIPSDLDMNMLANIMDTQLKIQLNTNSEMIQFFNSENHLLYELSYKNKSLIPMLLYRSLLFFS